MKTIAVVVSALLLFIGAASAQDVTFDQAIALALETPRVRGTARALEVRRRGDADLSGTSQGVSIEATPGVRIFSEEDRGFEGAISVLHSWNLGDLTGARRRAARAERQVLAAQVRAEALAARLEAGQRWIQLREALELERLLAEERALAQRLVEVTGRALSAGVGTAADLAEAHAYAADVEEREIALVGTRHDLSVALSVAMARPPSSALRTAGPLPSPALPDDAGPWLARAEHLPVVVATRLEALAERARAAEIHATYAPVLALGAQAQRESPSGVIVQGAAAFDVPLFDLAARERSAALGDATLRAAEATRAGVQARQTLVLAFHDVEHTQREQRAIVERLVPALVALVERREAALRAGEATVFELLDARRRLLGVRARAVQAESARVWAEVRLWTLLAAIEQASVEEVP